jgi:hypothetical protein
MCKLIIKPVHLVVAIFSHWDEHNNFGINCCDNRPLAVFGIFANFEKGISFNLPFLLENTHKMPTCIFLCKIDRSLCAHCRRKYTIYSCLHTHTHTHIHLHTHIHSHTQSYPLTKLTHTHQSYTHTHSHVIPFHHTHTHLYPHAGTHSYTQRHKIRFAAHFFSYFPQNCFLIRHFVT